MKLQELNVSEYPEYYQQYISLLPNEDLITLLDSQKEEKIGFLRRLKTEDMDFRYAEGKWTVAEVIQHMIDTERIFQFRALCIARNDKTSLPGYDQDAYVPVSNASNRSISELINEYESVRNSGILLFKSFNEKMLQRLGISNGYKLSAGAAGFIIAGHEKHHLELFKTNYLL